MNRFLLLLTTLFLCIILFACSDSVSNDDLVPFSFDTLDDECVPFSLDRGSTFKTINQKMEVFDIWNEATYDQVPSMVFFYAFSYKELLAEIEKAKNPDFNTYGYVDELELNNLLYVYNEAYFKENILIFYYKLEPNLSENYIYSITSKGNVLTINVNRIESMLTALSFHRHIITIKKSDILGIKHVNLIVRTVDHPQASVTYYIKSENIRDIYVSGKTLEDFNGLDNLSDIRIYTWSISISLTFMNAISDDDLDAVVSYLNQNPFVKSIQHTGKDYINIYIDNDFYDKAMERSIKINDFIDEEIINEYGLKMTMRNFSAIAFIEFFLENKGKDYASQMRKDLQDGDYPFLLIDNMS